MRSQRSWCLALCVLGACGRSDSVERPPVAEASTSAAPLTSPRTSADVVDAVPAFLASSCVSGDPVEGLVWSLDSVTVPSVPATALETLSPRDSALLAARLARMVDVLPADTSSAEFTGLPVTVQSAWRLVPADGDTIIVALAVRRIPIESAPREERVTIVAAPGARAGVRAPLVEGWVSREIGREEELVAREFGGAFVSSDGIAIAFIEDTDAGVRLAVVSRRSGQWISQWAGARAICNALDVPRDRP